MDAIKPGEKRLLSYAADLGVLVDANQKSESQRVTKVFIAHGMMTQSTQEREETPTPSAIATQPNEPS